MLRHPMNSRERDKQWPMSVGTVFYEAFSIGERRYIQRHVAGSGATNTVAVLSKDRGKNINLLVHLYKEKLDDKQRKT